MNKLKTLLITFVTQACLVLSTPTFAGATTRVNVSSSGEQALVSGIYPQNFSLAISADGRYVAFITDANNLVPNDTNDQFDVFVHDRQIGQTSRVNVSSSGEQASISSIWASTAGNTDPQSGLSISADGRYVAFVSVANNLVPNDTNEMPDVFVHDRQTGQTTRVNVSSDGQQTFLYSARPALSGDGRYVAFVSPDSNLVSGDVNRLEDVFVHDRETHTTTRVSVDSLGGEANGEAPAFSKPSISSDGRYVAFVSDADNMVPNDTNGVYDVFVHDRETQTTARVSVDSNGAEGIIPPLERQLFDSEVSISSDGRFVAFSSEANNLVPNDTNGAADVFVHDRQTGQTSRVSVDSNGAEIPKGKASFSVTDTVSISADGRYVAFESWSEALLPGDATNLGGIFVHDQQERTTTLVSVDSKGNRPLITADTNASRSPALASDGHSIAFWSWAHTLVPKDTNNQTDVFVHELGPPGQGPGTTPDPNSTADLAIAMAAPKSVTVGKSVTYRLRVTNKSKAKATSVLVTDQLPDTVTLVKSPRSCIASGSQLLCNLGTLGKKKIKRFTIKVKATTKGLATNTASVSSNSVSDTNLANNTATKSTTVR